MLTFALQVARGHSLPKRWRTFLRRLFHRTRWAIITVRPGFFPSGAAFAYMPTAARRFTQTLRLSLTDPVASNVAKLNDFKPSILTGYASVLEMLAREERAGRLRLRETGYLQQVVNMSEPLPQASREMIEQTFGVHVADHYATGECMALSIGCPYFSGAHLNADLAMMEVVDDHYQPVPNGVAGSKVLITSLYNHVQPIIRYEITDVVTMSDKPCPCGSNLPHIASIQGRTKDKFYVRVDGEYKELLPFIFVEVLNYCLELGEYQVMQTERNRFLLRGAPVAGKTLSVERLRSLIENKLQKEGMGGWIELDVEIVDAIKPDPRSGKMKRMQSRVGPPAGTEEAPADEAHLVTV
jgi:phenylacetate-coenzyme A ligase PaaK-like adenylate-forming protein